MNDWYVTASRPLAHRFRQASGWTFVSLCGRLRRDSGVLRTAPPTAPRCPRCLTHG